MRSLQFDIAHLLAGGMLVLSFLLLYQDRITAVLNVFACRRSRCRCAVAWQAYFQNAPHLYVTARSRWSSRASSFRPRCTGSSAASTSIARSSR